MVLGHIVDISSRADLCGGGVGLLGGVGSCVMLFIASRKRREFRNFCYRACLSKMKKKEAASKEAASQILPMPGSQQGSLTLGTTAFHPPLSLGDPSPGKRTPPKIFGAGGKKTPPGGGNDVKAVSTTRDHLQQPISRHSGDRSPRTAPRAGDRSPPGAADSADHGSGTSSRRTSLKGGLSGGGRVKRVNMMTEYKCVKFITKTIINRKKEAFKKKLEVMNQGQGLEQTSIVVGSAAGVVPASHRGTIGAVGDAAGVVPASHRGTIGAVDAAGVSASHRGTIGAVVGVGRSASAVGQSAGPIGGAARGPAARAGPLAAMMQREQQERRISAAVGKLQMIEGARLNRQSLVFSAAGMAGGPPIVVEGRSSLTSSFFGALAAGDQDSKSGSKSGSDKASKDGSDRGAASKELQFSHEEDATAATPPAAGDRPDSFETKPSAPSLQGSSLKGESEKSLKGDSVDKSFRFRDRTVSELHFAHDEQEDAAAESAPNDPKKKNSSENEPSSSLQTSSLKGEGERSLRGESADKSFRFRDRTVSELHFAHEEDLAESAPNDPKNSSENLSLQTSKSESSQNPTSPSILRRNLTIDTGSLDQPDHPRSSPGTRGRPASKSPPPELAAEQDPVPNKVLDQISAAWEQPEDVQDLDPEGELMFALTGTKQPVQEFFETFIKEADRSSNAVLFERNVYVGRAHKDLHGGNLLIDTEGLVWLIDFADVSEDVHVGFDLAKLLCSCLFM